MRRDIADCKANTPVKEMTLPEEIRALSEYGVPESVIGRILKKVNDCAEWERECIESRNTVIQELQKTDRNYRAVINALGAYLAIKEDGFRGV